MTTRATLALWNLAVQAYRQGHGRIMLDAMSTLRRAGATYRPPAAVAFGG